jgi:DNA-binding XRE family transcriptional regulator
VMTKRTCWENGAIDRRSILDNVGFQQTYKTNARGLKKGTKLSFEQATRIEEPRTPFEALRFTLKIKQCDWAEMLQVTIPSLGAVERGTVCGSVPVAKRMQEEARKMGVMVTLDELYQHVVPWKVDSEVEKDNN